MTHDIELPGNAEPPDASPFTEYCERLWRDWLANRPVFSDFTGKVYCPEAAPEPYVIYGDTSRPLVFLLTNPGGVIDWQTRTAIASGSSIVRAGWSYKHVARHAGAYYETKLSGAARIRVKAMSRLARELGYTGFLQVDSCPVHSQNLPMARKLEIVARARKADGLMREYAALVTEFLRSRPVVAVTGAASRVSLQESRELPEWPSWVASLIGLDPAEATWSQISDRPAAGGTKVTAAALIGNAGRQPRVLVRMMGSNNLPALERLGYLADAVRERIRRHGPRES